MANTVETTPLNIEAVNLDDELEVDAFHEALCTGITQHLGVRPALWRDTRLRGNEDFPAEIEDGLAASAIFLPIFSPAYLNSAWCRRSQVKRSG